MSDAFAIFTWWLLFLVLGCIFLPLTQRIFYSFFDRGYIFSKTLSAIVVSYIMLVLGFTKLIPFTTLSVFVIVGICFIVNYFVLKPQDLRQFLKRKWETIFFEEVMFLIVLAGLAFIRAHEPTINGLEKFMDFGFMNSILKSKTFPPKDMWFTPLSINYYYFGHLVTAVLTKLSMLPSFVTYNLMLATIFGLGFVSAFSIAGNLLFIAGKKIKKEVIVVGILAAFLVMFAGNLQTLYSFFKPYQNEKPQPPWELQFSPQTFSNSYWYPNATRFIPYTIHEFPMYSFVVADLHGHVLSIPYVLLTLAVILSAYSVSYAKPPLPEHKKRILLGKLFDTFVGFTSLTRRKVYMFILIGFLVSVLYMTNAWDGPIYFAIACLSLTVSFIVKKRDWLIRSICTFIIIFVSFAAFSLPFSLSFKPFVSGFGMVCPPEFLIKMEKIGPFLFEADHCQKSEFYQWIILWGFFMFFALVFSIFKILKHKKEDIYNASDYFVFCLIGFCLFLLIVPEFFYAKDIYPTHFRANTMFKLGYQAFIMLSICSAYIIIRITKHFKHWWFAIPTFFLLCLVFLYPYFSTMSYYGAVEGLKPYQGLDGLKYLEKTRPDDYKAIVWMNKTIQGQPVILEAQGDSYTDYGRISINTGLPTVLGWTVHEWLWRGSYDVPAPRIDEVKRMYESQDLAETKSLLDKYEVKYVYVGGLEREKYPALYEQKFNQLGTVVFESGDSRLYKLN